MAQSELSGNLLTVRQFVAKNCGAWPSTESTVRALISDASWGKNNFQSAFKRVGRRVLIDVPKFWACVDLMQGDRKDAR